MTLASINVHDLLGRPGATRRTDVLGTIEGLATELVAVPDDAPVGGSLLLESLIEGILVTGAITGSWTARCARCLAERTQPFSVGVSELFVPAGTVDPDDDEDDRYELMDDSIDLDQLVRDAIGVEMPFAPLCRADCKGLCPICGGDRNDGECPGHETIDPRFAVLADLLPDLPDD